MLVGARGMGVGDERKLHPSGQAQAEDEGGELKGPPALKDAKVQDATQKPNSTLLPSTNDTKSSPRPLTKVRQLRASPRSPPPLPKRNANLTLILTTLPRPTPPPHQGKAQAENAKVADVRAKAKAIASGTDASTTEARPRRLPRTLRHGRTLPSRPKGGSQKAPAVYNNIV